MVDPVNRCQSPISTDSPNPVNVDTPRRQHNRRTTGGVLAAESHLGDRVIQPVPAGRGEQHRLEGGIERQLQPRQREMLPAQPLLVHPGPRMPTGIQDPLAQQQFRQPMPGPHQITTDIFPGPDQIPRRLLFHARHPDLDDLIHPQQLGKVLRVSRIGLDPITRRPLQFRRRRHHTPDPRPSQLPRQPEPRRPRLIGHRDRRRQLRQPVR